MGSYLSKQDAAFDPRDCDHGKLGELAAAQSFVEVRKKELPTGLSQLWVRLEPKKPNAA